MCRLSALYRWECRYSSSEMFYVELEAGGGIRAYLHHSPDSATHLTADEVLAGEFGGEITALFDKEERDQMQQAVRQWKDRSL